MTTYLNALRHKVSQQIDDYWVSTATGGDADKLDVIDTALSTKQADFLSTGSDEQTQSTVLITEDTVGSESKKEERGVDAALSTSTVSFTPATTQQQAVDDKYEINRLFTAAEKERAIKYACYSAYPQLYKLVDDQSIRFGSWLRDGDFEVWSSSSALTYFTAGTLTVTRTTTAAYLRSGTYVALLASAGSAGTLYQSWNPGGTTTNADLQFLAGKEVIFRAWAWTAKASEVCLSIADGTTTTYGNHTSHQSSSKVLHPGDSTWRLLEVQATIATNPTQVTFSVVYDGATGDAYIDEASVTAVGGKYAYNISDLGLKDNTPSQIYLVHGRAASIDTPMPKSSVVKFHGWDKPTNDGILRFNQAIRDGQRLRILGRGYLTQPADADANVITGWTPTEVDAPQDEIIVAEAIIYLYNLMKDRARASDIPRYRELIADWEKESRRRKARWGMPDIPAEVHYT